MRNRTVAVNHASIRNFALAESVDDSTTIEPCLSTFYWNGTDFAAEDVISYETHVTLTL